jgi:DNA polymerase III gamma/tau subunit
MTNIQNLYESGRFPHAILFIDGGSESVEQVINLYKCAPADTVRVKESMPDESYKIAPLREIIASGNMRPQFGDTRVFAFNDFDSMSEICQNALLKFIEEPHEFNRFVMTAGSTSKILPTILSRVVLIRSDDCAGDDGNPPVNSDTPADEITSSIITALKSKSEYDTAAAFAKIKDRQLLAEVLQSLLQELSIIMKTAKNPENIIKATDILQKYIKRIEVNPNIPMTVTSCAAEIYKELRR